MGIYGASGICCFSQQVQPTSLEKHGKVLEQLDFQISLLTMKTATTYLVSVHR